MNRIADITRVVGLCAFTLAIGVLTISASAATIPAPSVSERDTVVQAPLPSPAVAQPAAPTAPAPLAGSPASESIAIPQAGEVNACSALDAVTDGSTSPEEASRP